MREFSLSKAYLAIFFLILLRNQSLIKKNNDNVDMLFSTNNAFLE